MIVNRSEEQAVSRGQRPEDDYKLLVIGYQWEMVEVIQFSKLFNVAMFFQPIPLITDN